MLSQPIIHKLHEFIWYPTLANTLLCSAAFLRQVELRWSWSHRDKGAISLKISGVALTCTNRHLPTVCAVMCWTCNIWKTHVITLLAHRLTRLNSLGFALASVREAPVNFKRAVQPVGQDVLHKLQMKKDKWRRQAKLDAVEELLWGKQQHHSLKQRLCTALGRTATSLLHDASLALDDLSIVIAPGQSPKVQ